MDVQVDGELIRTEREKRAWSQEHLAGAAGIGARTVQRIEAGGTASYETVRAISAAFDIPIDRLMAARASTPGSAAVARTPPARLRLAARWLGATVVMALLAGASGFFLLQDYQKVRVLRTVEHWVTDAQR
jgi:transcriptional regulator with XRE-family HTH domain